MKGSELEEELKKRYPVYGKEEIRKIHATFSICPHGNEKYVVEPKINVVHLLWGYTVYLMATSPFPMSLLCLPIIGGCGYAIYISSNSKEHELSHAYRRRYLKFMEEVKGKSEEDSSYVKLVDNLENICIKSKNKVKSALARELSLLLSIPVVVGGYATKMGKTWYWEEELAKYETEKLTGIKRNSTSPEKKKFLEILESFRTDEYVPLKDCEEVNNLDYKLRFLLENPPSIIPKYEMIDKLYKDFKKSEGK